jgi:hypothetical protein
MKMNVSIGSRVWLLAANPSVCSVFSPDFPRKFENSPECQPSFPLIIPFGVLKITCKNNEKCYILLKHTDMDFFQIDPNSPLWQHLQTFSNASTKQP